MIWEDMWSVDRKWPGRRWKCRRINQQMCKVRIHERFHIIHAVMNHCQNIECWEAVRRKKQQKWFHPGIGNGGMLRCSHPMATFTLSYGCCGCKHLDYPVIELVRGSKNINLQAQSYWEATEQSNRARRKKRVSEASECLLRVKKCSLTDPHRFVPSFVTTLSLHRLTAFIWSLQFRFLVASYCVSNFTSTRKLTTSPKFQNSPALPSPDHLHRLCRCLLVHTFRHPKCSSRRTWFVLTPCFIKWSARSLPCSARFTPNFPLVGHLSGFW